MADDVTQEITTLLGAIREGNEPMAAARLFPLVYDELRRMAAHRMASERTNHTLQATALVHEAYLRLVDSELRQEPDWTSRRHFFGAAAQAMRRILVEHARKRNAQKHGGGRKREAIHSEIAADQNDDATLVDHLALDEALTKLEEHDSRLAELVMLRYFAGLTTEQTASAMELSSRTVKRDWACARAWLYQRMSSDESLAEDD